jgi:hypothetical protein
MGNAILTPFDSKRYVGSVCQVDPESVRINLPRAAAACASRYGGHIIPGGQVGEFVFIESDECAILGRITEVRLPEKERLTVESKIDENTPEANPIGFVQLLTTMQLGTWLVIPGIKEYPRIGQHVYSAHPSLIKHVIERVTKETDGFIEIATIPHAARTVVKINPSQLFGRHCAILGSTGGGKSWTLARIVEEIARLGGKAILIDATGEFSKIKGNVKHVYLGGEHQGAEDRGESVCFPFHEFSDMDLFSLFQPSGASQAPKLREALKSLKLVQLDSTFAKEGLLIKANQVRDPIIKLLIRYASEINTLGAKYNISKLPQQIVEECVWPNGWVGTGANRRADYSIWGDLNQQEQGWTTSLIARIELIVNSPELRCVFNPGDMLCLPQVIEEFLHSKDKVLRISLEDLSFEHNARELIANALGRYLLKCARKGDFRKMPTVVILDEAHQFLNKHLGDETNRITLDAFGLIAKEGRKYGLTCILATQRPRDIPDDVLSQMGMFVVHRLINELDRKIVEKACGHLDGAAAAFLPVLGQGEAILVGADFPMPMPVQVIQPDYPPESHGPAYDELWKCKNDLGEDATDSHIDSHEE